MSDSTTEASALRRSLASVGRSVRDLVDATTANDLLTHASAMTYQILFALPAVLLAGLAILGLLDLREVWQQELAPRLERMTAPVLFDFLQSSVDEVLGARSGFWLTLGTALALWYVSSATRVLMGVTNRIYRETERRVLWRRLVVSVLLSLAGVGLFGLAAVLLYVGPLLIDRLDVGFGLQFLAGSVEWLLSLVCLYAAQFLFVRFGPAHARVLHRRSLTALAIVVGWLIASFGFRWYVTALARYESVFGNLASVMITMVYVHLCTIVVVYGLQIDAMVRDRATRE